MAENTSRNIFGLNGITGMLIATVLLLSILAFLVTSAVKVQSENAIHYYQIKDPQGLEFKNTNNANHYDDELKQAK